jgi:hypothetical protein
MRLWVLLVILLLVGGWYLTTPDGHDLLGVPRAHKPGPAAVVDFNKLAGGLKETDVTAMDPALDWLCTVDDPQNKGQFGQRVCDAYASSINRIPGNRVDYLFRDGSLSFAIFEYKSDSFPALKAQLDKVFPRRPSKPDQHPGPDLDPIRAMLRQLHLTHSDNTTSWFASRGILTIAPDGTNDQGNIILLWTSDKEIWRDKLPWGNR